jgi:hypothetical protein
MLAITRNGAVTTRRKDAPKRLQKRPATRSRSLIAATLRAVAPQKSALIAGMPISTRHPSCFGEGFTDNDAVNVVRPNPSPQWCDYFSRSIPSVMDVNPIRIVNHVDAEGKSMVV